ncbi:MAG: helix-turn-helix transcriptional regulator, partial [Rubrobacteridae bacterium]|nr:helix-turn-helix transcriptional regulator [Rubrobacteridae bacterium]
VDRSLLNKWVKGKHNPSVYFMTKIARELQMTEQDIFFDADFMKKTSKGEQIR